MWFRITDIFHASLIDIGNWLKLNHVGHFSMLKEERFGGLCCIELFVRPSSFANNFMDDKEAHKLVEEFFFLCKFSDEQFNSSWAPS